MTSTELSARAPPEVVETLLNLAPEKAPLWHINITTSLVCMIEVKYREYEWQNSAGVSPGSSHDIYSQRQSYNGIPFLSRTKQGVV